MIGIQPLSLDSSLEAEALVFDHYRRLRADQKLAIVFDLTRMVEQAALVRIRERHPHATEHEQLLRLATLKYGKDLVRAAYGQVVDEMDH